MKINTFLIGLGLLCSSALITCQTKDTSVKAEKSLWDTTTEKLAEATAKTKQAVKDAAAWTKTKAEQASDKLKEAAAKTKADAERVAEKAKTASEDVAGDAEKKADKAASEAKAKFAAGWEKTKEVARETWVKTKDITRTAWLRLKEMFAAKKQVDESHSELE